MLQGQRNDSENSLTTMKCNKNYNEQSNSFTATPFLHVQYVPGSDAG
jgi:hypothetical protein